MKNFTEDPEVDYDKIDVPYKSLRYYFSVGMSTVITRNSDRKYTTNSAN